MLGALPHNAVLKHVSNSFCVLYPNYVFPETFGLVFAEANAVGTPVLGHAIGAASEVLSDNEQLVDCKQIKNVVDRFEKWQREGRPKVEAREEFKIFNVVQNWLKLLSK
jgi:glycosyltransferase involved in cell wall biosynthesis